MSDARENHDNEQFADPRRYMKALRARRRALGIDQAVVAKHVGVDKSTISRLEKHGLDDGRTLGFLRWYAEAVRLELRIGFVMVKE